MPNIFEYNDYRKFLEDYQAAAHENRPSFSHRNFALKAGFTSTGLLSNIMKGRRNLTDPLIPKFARALKLNKKEELYFEHLVHFNQAVSIEDKNKYYARMLQVSPLKAKTVCRNRHTFYSQWWYSAIRELLYYYPFRDDYRTLANQLDPPIGIEQAREAIVKLEELGMISKDANGYYHQTDNIITTGTLNERSLNVQNFQLATMNLARESLQRHKREIRDISTLTLTLSPESVEKVKSEIASLQKKLLSIAEEDQNVNTVTIDCILFPNDTFVYQVAALGTDGWEGEPLTGDPFFNKSAIITEELVKPDKMDSIVKAAATQERFHLNRFGVYYFKQSDMGSDYFVYKMTPDLAVQRSASFKGTMAFYCSIASDADGNIYHITGPSMDRESQSKDTVYVIKCDRDLNLISKYGIQLGRGPQYFSLAVSSDGTLILYGTNGSPTRDPAEYDTTNVTVFSPGFSMVSDTFYRDCRIISQSVNANDSVTAVIESNAWEFRRLYYLIQDFTSWEHPTH